jgi:hypothetical protein
VLHGLVVLQGLLEACAISVTVLSVFLGLIVLREEGNVFQGLVVTGGSCVLCIVVPRGLLVSKGGASSVTGPVVFPG